jgi:hypothetical protein
MPVPSLSILALSDSMTAEAAKPLDSQLRCLQCEPIEHAPFLWRPRASAKRKLIELTVTRDIESPTHSLGNQYADSPSVPIVLSDSHSKNTSKAYKPDNIKY